MGSELQTKLLTERLRDGFLHYWGWGKRGGVVWSDQIRSMEDEIDVFHESSEDYYTCSTVCLPQRLGHRSSYAPYQYKDSP